MKKKMYFRDGEKGLIGKKKKKEVKNVKEQSGSPVKKRK